VSIDCNSQGRLSLEQLRSLRRSALVEFFVFSFVFLSLCFVGAFGFYFFALSPKPADSPFLLFAAMDILFALLFVLGCILGWIAFSMLLFRAKLSEARVLLYEGAPVKRTFTYRQSANLGGGSSMLLSPQIAGAWLEHEKKAYAVDLDLFRRIPDKGFFRFYYISRPGFRFVLPPRRIIAFDTACRCMTPPFDYQDFDSVTIGVDETRGRFGEVSVETCKACRNKWLRYFVEYESVSKSARWYRGLVSEEVARTVKPETAVEVLQSLDWRFAGGSYFGSTGLRSTDPVLVDP
jgi:hypothetical protein